jgi:MFS family permease
MEAQNTGVWIAMAAILVQAPRLVLAVLAADRQVIEEDWQRRLLMLAGFGTALVLTGGNLYLAHAIARVRRWRAGLVVVWLVVLASTGGLVVPMIAAGIGGRTLPQVLGAHLLAWAWSLLAALAHEVTAAGCILSAAALRNDDVAAAQEQSHALAIAELLSQRDAARRERDVLAQRTSQSQRQLAPVTSGASGRMELPAAGEPAAASLVLVACREGCGKQFASALAEMGHLRHCPVRLKRRGQRLPQSNGGEPA